MDFAQILNYIARTNLFNFIIFAGIIIYLCLKFKANEQIEAVKTSVTETIEESETRKEDSQTKLSAIEESMLHLEEEVTAILDKSEENAKLIGEKILEDGKKSALIIKENTEKALENSQIILKNELIRRAALASLEVAKSQILQELNLNPELHDKLINESIDSIEGVQL